MRDGSAWCPCDICRVAYVGDVFNRWQCPPTALEVMSCMFPIGVATMYTFPPTASCSCVLPLPRSSPSSPTSASLSDDVMPRPTRLWFRRSRRPSGITPSLLLEKLAAGHRAGETLPSPRDPRPPAHAPPLNASHLALPWRSCGQQESEASGHGSTSTGLPPPSWRKVLSRCEMAGRGGRGGA